MSRKRASITLSIAQHEKVRLEALALNLGQTWGDRPNVSKLIKAIANNKLKVGLNNDWSRDRIDTLYKALNLLKDEGYYSEALELAQILVDRSELSHPLRHEIQAWLDSPGQPWRKDIDKFIRQVRPFRLTYEDAAERIWNFTVRYATIQHHEDRQYLDCWCDETQGNQDIEALQHNWCLRLDRIPPEAIITPVEGQWYPGLDCVDVEFHLINQLAVRYRVKQGTDLTNKWLPEQKVRRITRRIENTFWFFRAIKRYSPDCIIVSPSEVCELYKHNLIAEAANYGLLTALTP